MPPKGRKPIKTTFYVATVFALAYATMLRCILITAALGFVSKPIYGALSDRIGRRPIYLAGSLIGTLVTFPFFWALETRVAILIFLAFFLIINISHDLNDAVESSFFSEQFSTRVRYTGAALGHQFGAAITGFTPLIAGALSVAGGWTLVASYVMLACLVSALCVYLAPETFRKDISASDSDERQVVVEPGVQ
jgi:MFS family permease